MNTLRQSCPARNWSRRAGDPDARDDPYCSDPLPVARRRRDPGDTSSRLNAADWMRDDVKKGSRSELESLKSSVSELLKWEGAVEKDLTTLDALEKRMGFTSMGLSQLHELLEYLFARLFDMSVSDLAGETKKLCSKVIRNHMETYSSLSTLRSVLTELSADEYVQPYLEPVIGYVVESPKVTPYEGRVLSRQCPRGGALNRRTSFPSFDAHHHHHHHHHHQHPREHAQQGGGHRVHPSSHNDTLAAPRRMLSGNLQGVSASYTFGTSGASRISELGRGPPPPPGPPNRLDGLGSSSGWKLQRQLERHAFGRGARDGSGGARRLAHSQNDAGTGAATSLLPAPSASHTATTTPPPLQGAAARGAHRHHHSHGDPLGGGGDDAESAHSVESGFYADSSEGGGGGCVGGWGDESDTETVVHRQGTPHRPGTQSTIHTVERLGSPGRMSFESTPMYSPNSPCYSGLCSSGGSDAGRYSTDSDHRHVAQRRVIRSRERGSRQGRRQPDGDHHAAAKSRGGKSKKQRRTQQQPSATPPTRPSPEHHHEHAGHYSGSGRPHGGSGGGGGSAASAATATHASPSSSVNLASMATATALAHTTTLPPVATAEGCPERRPRAMCSNSPQGAADIEVEGRSGPRGANAAGGGPRASRARRRDPNPDAVQPFEAVDANLSSLFADEGSQDEAGGRCGETRGTSRRAQRSGEGMALAEPGEFGNAQPQQRGRKGAGKARHRADRVASPPQKMEPSPGVGASSQHRHLHPASHDALFNETGSSIHTIIDAAGASEDDDASGGGSRASTPGPVVPPRAADAGCPLQPIRSESPVMPERGDLGGVAAAPCGPATPAAERNPPPPNAVEERPSSSWIRGGRVEIRCLDDPSLHVTSVPAAALQPTHPEQRAPADADATTAVKGGEAPSIGRGGQPLYRAGATAAVPASTTTPLSHGSYSTGRAYETDAVSPPSAVTTPMKDGGYWPQAADASPSLSSFSTSVASVGGPDAHATLARSSSLEHSGDHTGGDRGGGASVAHAPAGTLPSSGTGVPPGPATTCVASRSASNASNASRESRASGGVSVGSSCGSGVATVPASTPNFAEQQQMRGGGGMGPGEKRRRSGDGPLHTAAQRPPVAGSSRGPGGDPSAPGGGLHTPGGDDCIITPRTTMRSKRHSARSSPAHGRPNVDTHIESVGSNLEAASAQLASSMSGGAGGGDVHDLRRSWEHGDAPPQGPLRVRSISPSKRYRSPRNGGSVGQDAASEGDSPSSGDTDAPRTAKTGSGSLNASSSKSLRQTATIQQGTLRRRSTSPKGDRKRGSCSAGNLLEQAALAKAQQHPQPQPAGASGAELTPTTYVRASSDSCMAKRVVCPTRPAASESGSSRDTSPHRQRVRRPRSPGSSAASDAAHAPHDPVALHAEAVQQELQHQIDAIAMKSAVPLKASTNHAPPKHYSPRPPQETTDSIAPPHGGSALCGTAPPPAPGSRKDRNLEPIREPATPPGAQQASGSGGGHHRPTKAKNREGKRHKQSRSREALA